MSHTTLTVSLCSMLLYTYTHLSHFSEVLFRSMSLCLQWKLGLEMITFHHYIAEWKISLVFYLNLSALQYLLTALADRFHCIWCVLLIILAAFVLFTAKKINDWFSVRSCLSYGLLLLFVKNPVHSELLSIPSQCDHTVSVFAEAYCICYGIALTLVCKWICHFVLLEADFILLFWFAVLLNILSGVG